jgi:flavin-dependent dehydrogenase
MLDQMDGHSYYLFDRAHVRACQRDGAVLVGDALGLAHTLTAEGILPAVLSGRIAAQAITSGDSARYATTLAEHPIMRDYALAFDLLRAALALRDRFSSTKQLPLPRPLERATRRATARGFAWLFSGHPIPYAGALEALSRALLAVS